MKLQLQKYFSVWLIFIFFLSSCTHQNKVNPESTEHSNHRVGCICRDGWHSHATGKGACSHHGGVDHWLYEDDKK